jgi:hypothetical protein
MKRVLFWSVAALLLIALPIHAQQTVVTATVKDPNGIPYAGGTVQEDLQISGGPATVTINNQQQCSAASAGTAPCQIPINGHVNATPLDPTGTFQITLYSNTSITPASSTWLFTINISPGIPLPLGTGPQQFQVAVTVTGATQNISATLSAAAPSLTNFSGTGPSGCPGTAVSPQIFWDNAGACAGITGSAVTTAGDVSFTGSTVANLVWKHTPGYVATGTNDTSPDGIIAGILTSYGTSGFTHSIFSYGGSTNNTAGVAANISVLEFSGVTTCTGDMCGTGGFSLANADVATTNTGGQLDASDSYGSASYSSGQMDIVGSNALAQDLTTATGVVGTLAAFRGAAEVGNHSINAFAFEAQSPFKFISFLTPPTILAGYHCKQQDNANAIGAGTTACFYIDDQGTKLSIFSAGGSSIFNSDALGQTPVTINAFSNAATAPALTVKSSGTCPIGSLVLICGGAESGTTAGGLFIDDANNTQYSISFHNQAGAAYPNDSQNCYQDTGGFFECDTFDATGNLTTLITGPGTANLRASSGLVSTTDPVQALKFLTSTNCANGASPAVCASAASGAVAVPTGTNPTLVIDTSAVTASSRIFVDIDESLTISGTTCNTTLATLAHPVVTARSAGVSFTIQIPATLTANPACVSYVIFN